MQIKKLKLTNLHNGEHFTFHTAFRDMVNAVTPAVLGIEALFAAYLAVYAKLDEAFKKIIKSGQTGRIVDLDNRRDRMFRGMVDTVKGALNHFNTGIAASARRIMIVLETYGNLNVMTTDDETAMLYNLLKDLREKCAVDVETLGLDAWIDELDNLNRALQAAMAARVNEIAARTPLVYSTVRTEIDMAYRALVRRIDALEEVGGTGEGAPWAAFITDLNVVIERSNNLMAIRKGKAAAGKKKAEEQEQESEN